MIWSIETSKTEINRVLKDFFAINLQAAQRLDEDYARLWNALDALVMSGGKRLRPHLCIVAYQAFGGAAPTSICEVAAAQELLHASLLIHDDIIDRDYVRYGVDNIAGRYRQFYASPGVPKAETNHLADGAALLSGDLLLSGAFQLISQSSLPPTKIIEAQQQLQQALFHVAGGELLDTEAVLKEISEVDTVKMMELKTAHYSFISPLLTGARLADASEADLKQLVQYGLHLGVAYQLVDDILGVFGDEAAIGKPASSDLQEAKRTYLIQETLRRSDEEGQTMINKTIGKRSVKPKDYSIIRAEIQASGALKAVQKQAQMHAHTAVESLDKLDILPETKTALVTLATKVIDTSKRSVASFDA